MDAIAGGRDGTVVTGQTAAKRKRKRLKKESQDKCGDKPKAADAAGVQPLPKDNPVPIAAVLGPAGREGYSAASNIFPYINPRCAVSRPVGIQEAGSCQAEEYESDARRKGAAGIRGTAAAGRRGRIPRAQGRIWLFPGAGRRETI